MTSHLERRDGLLQLERTGPFMPPITFSGINEIVVTTAMREALTAAGFRGLSFHPVHKALIVPLHWQDWDISAEKPKQYPRGGDPEDYILGHKHCEETSAALGDVWELVAPHGVTVDIDVTGDKFDDPLFYRYTLHADNDADLFSDGPESDIYCSLRGKQWLERHFARWLRCVVPPTQSAE